MKPTPIVDGLHAVAVGPVDVFLLDTPGGLALVDTGLPDRADGILQAMRRLGRAPRDLRHIELTHAHPDHIGSLGPPWRGPPAPKPGCTRLTRRPWNAAQASGR